MNNTLDNLINLTVTQIVLITIEAFIGVVIVAGNSVTYVALYRARSLQMSLRLFLLTMSMNDVASGLFFVYHSFAMYLIRNDYVECVIRYSAVSTTSAISLYILTMVSLERVIFLMLPSRYTSLVTKKTVTIVILICVLGPIITVVSAMMTATHNIKECRFVELLSYDGYMLFAISSLILIAITILCHAVMFKAALEQIKRIVPLQMDSDRFKTAIKMNVKATVTTAYIVIPFIVCTTPLYSLFLYLAIHNDARHYRYIMLIVNTAFSLQIINSLVNPFIYTWRFRTLKMEVAKYVPFLKLQRHSDTDPQ